MEKNKNKSTNLYRVIVFSSIVLVGVYWIAWGVLTQDQFQPFRKKMCNSAGLMCIHLPPLQDAVIASSLRNVPPFGGPSKITEDFIEVAFNNANFEESFWTGKKSDHSSLDETNYVQDIIKRNTKQAIYHYKLEEKRLADLPKENPEFRFYARPNGSPDTNKIAKFNSPVVVRLLNLSGTFVHEFSLEGIVEEALLKLNRVNGVDISLDNTPKSLQDFENTIYIVFENFSVVNFFKQLRGIKLILPHVYSSSSLKYMYPISNLGVSSKLKYFFYQGMIEFTPFSKAQVDGFLLLNDDGSIHSARCHIWRGHTAAMIENLIQECLLRSMGLTNLSKHSDAQLLKNWNVNQEQYSSTQREHGEKVIYHHGGKLGGEMYKVPVYRAKQYNQSSTINNLNWWSKAVEERGQQGTLAYSEYDLLLLTLLYHKNIKAGMTREGAIMSVPAILTDINNRLTK